jgi:hypothetical protein
VVWLDESLRA